MLDEYLKKYAARFKEDFPIYWERWRPESEIISIINQCLDDGKPHQLTVLDDAEIDY